MGRVYEADGQNRISFRAFTAKGHRIPFVTRVEFDGDESAGMADVSLIPEWGGEPLVDLGSLAVVEARARQWVRVVSGDESDPPETPNAVLYKRADGVIEWHADDPLSDEVMALLRSEMGN